MQVIQQDHVCGDAHPYSVHHRGIIQVERCNRHRHYPLTGRYTRAKHASEDHSIPLFDRLHKLAITIKRTRERSEETNGAPYFVARIPQAPFSL